MNEGLAYLWVQYGAAVLDEIDYYLRDLDYDSDLMLIIADKNFGTGIKHDKGFKQLLNYKKYFKTLE